MTVDTKASDRGPAFAETLGLALSAALIYGISWQKALHGTDWRWFVLWLDEPGAVHPQHPGYLLVARVFRWLLSPFDLDAYTVLAVLSVLGGVVAIAGFHRAFRALFADRFFARMATLMVMFAPALWHHATVVELHTPFAAVMAWTSWLVIRWVAGGGFGLAVLAGALSGIATLMHATGHLFVLVVAAFVAWRCRDRGWSWLVASVSAFGIAHSAVWAGLFVVIRATGDLPRSVGETAPGNPADYLLAWWSEMDFFTQLPPTVLNEWLLPFAPVSVLLLVALGIARWRAAAALTCTLLLVYLVATVALVHAWTDERGAYLLPLLLPMVALAFAIVPRRFWQYLVLAGLIAGPIFRGEPGRLPPDHEFGLAAVMMNHEARTVFFVADFPEMDGAFRADPRLDLKLARKEYDDLQASALAEFEPTRQQITGWLTMLTVHAKNEQARFVITDRAVEWLSERVSDFEAGFETFAERLRAERLPADARIEGWVVR